MRKHDFLFIAGFCSNLNNSLSSPFSRDNCQWMWNVGLETNVGLDMGGLKYFIWCVSRKHQNLNSCTFVSLRCPGELYDGLMEAAGIKQGRGAGWQRQGNQHAVCIWLPRAFTLTIQHLDWTPCSSNTLRLLSWPLPESTEGHTWESAFLRGQSLTGDCPVVEEHKCSISLPLTGQPASVT